jgi:hypothetical protein
VFVTDDWQHTLGTTQADGGSETELNLALSDFDLYEWPELQTWSTSAGVRAAVDLMGPGFASMLPVGWFRDVRQRTRALEREGMDPWVADAGGLVSGAYTRPIPDVELLRGGFTLLAWARLEPGATVVRQGGSKTMVRVILGAGGAFNVTLDLTTREESGDRVYAFGLFHDELPGGLLPTTPLDHTVQLISLWVDVEKELMGIRVGATNADSVIALPASMATALATTTQTGGRLSIAAKAGQWTLSGFELHAGRLSDSDLVVRDIVFRDRALSKLSLGAQRLPVSFTLYAPGASRYLALTGGPGAWRLTTTPDRSAAATWIRQDQAHAVVRIKHADSDTWLRVGGASDLDHGRPSLSTSATQAVDLRVVMQPNGHIAFEDARNVWMRATDSTADPVKGTELAFPPPLGEDHAWVARPAPLLVAVQADPANPTLPGQLALYNAGAGGYLSTRAYEDLSDDKFHPYYDPTPTFWYPDRTHIKADTPSDVVMLRERATGKWLGASGGVWTLVDTHTDAWPVRFVALSDGRYAFQNVMPSGEFMGQDVASPIVTTQSALTEDHTWTVKVLQ